MDQIGSLQTVLYLENKEENGNVNTLTFCLQHVLFTVQISYAQAFSFAIKEARK